MSRDSKTRRDARRKQDGARRIRRLGRPIQPHAHLRDGDGHVVGGGGLREQDWLMLLGGQVVATTQSPALLLAMLRHTQAVAAASRPLRLDASPVLLRAAAAEAEAHGHTLEEHLAVLEQERAARNAEPPPA